MITLKVETKTRFGNYHTNVREFNSMDHFNNWSRMMETKHGHKVTGHERIEDTHNPKAFTSLEDAIKQAISESSKHWDSHFHVVPTGDQFALTKWYEKTAEGYALKGTYRKH